MTLTLFELLSALKTCDPKRVVIKDKPGHRSIDFAVDCSAVVDELHLYVRQNAMLMEDYSCGLSVGRGRSAVTFLRVNGFSHPHRNPDGARLVRVPHIHIDLPELDSPPTTPAWAFETGPTFARLDGAFRLLLQVANVRLVDPARVHRGVRKCGDPTSGQLKLEDLIDGTDP